jgi:hypothetical protein
MAEDKHLVVPEGQWKFKRQRKDRTHIEACNSGYDKAAMGHVPRWLEVHHLLCVHACSDKTMGDLDKTYIKACLAITDWCINDHTYEVPKPESNLIGLPTKQAYVEDPTAYWNLLPCHQVDHDIYLDDVNTYVTEQIWKTLEQAQDEKACEELEAKNIKALFTTGCKKWRAHLVERGSVPFGTKASLDYCFEPEPHPIINDQNWHIPFSMAESKTDIRQRVKPKFEPSLLRDTLLDIK